jgi:DNA-directed RNA polymerase subunit F
MANAELKNELNDLLENAESVKSLDPMKRGALKDKLLSLPDMKMRQAIEQLKDEGRELEAEDRDLAVKGVEARNEARTLHTLMLKEQRKGETAESLEKSEKILDELKKEPADTAKKGRGGLLAIVLLLMLVAAAALILKYLNYF